MYHINYKIITEASELPFIANRIASATDISIDLETEGFDPYRGRIRLISMTIDDYTVVLDLFQTQTLSPVDDALRSSKALFILQNAVFDQK